MKDFVCTVVLLYSIVRESESNVSDEWMWVVVAT